MAKKKQNIPTAYGTAEINGVTYFRTRITRRRWQTGSHLRFHL